MHQRVEKVRERLAQLKLDAFLISSLANIRYLFGFTGSNGIALITSGLSFFISDRRYTQQAHNQVNNAKILIAQKDLLGELKKTGVLSSDGRLGLETAHLTVKEYSYLRKNFPKMRPVACERIIERIASIKEAAEIESIGKAAAICGKVYAEILRMIKPGISELEVSAEISYRSKLSGSESDPFEPIVASGVRSALPHGISSKKKLLAGDLVILDFGAVVDDYASDFTRTIVLGRPTSQQEEMFDVVESALRLSQSSVRSGMKGKDLDKIARDHLTERNYGEFFQHSLGHGIGLEVHGLPRIGERSNDPLEVGHVIALEPGVYVPDVGGVRIEDDFVITENGVENLSDFSRELVCAG